VLRETGDHPGRARDHYEAALDLNASSGWAHNNYALLLKNEEAVRDIEAAKAHYERAARLFSGRGPPEHFRVSARGLIAACEESSGTADAVRELYRVSVRNAAEGFDDVAERTAGAAWEHRTDLDREDGAYPTALAAGVWYAAHHSLAGWDDAEAVAETVREAVEPHLDRLSPTVRALYTLRLADEPAPSPDELRERSDAGDDLAEPDIDAYERLLGAFGD